MDRGYIKLYRKILDSRVFQNEGLLKLWLWSLLRASHKEKWVKVKTGRGFTEVHLLPGQFIFGRKSAARKLNMKPEAVRKRMMKLENLGNLTTQRTTHYSIINIVNWGIYQGTNEKGPSKGPPKDHPRTTNKNDKNKEYSQNSDEFRLSELLLTLILQRRGTFKKPDLHRWARHIDLMIRVDKRKPKEIEKVIRWSQKNHFWRNNILSTSKLRAQFDQLAMKMNETKGEGPTPSYYRRLI